MTETTNWDLPPIRFFVCLNCEYIHREDSEEGQFAFIDCRICRRNRMMYRVDYETAKTLDPLAAWQIAAHDFQRAMNKTLGPLVGRINRLFSKE